MIIIAVDENRDDLDLISNLIYDADPDSEIIEYEDPLAALGYARQTRVDVAFIAIQMSDLNGLELGKYLKELNPSVNIIFLSEDDDDAGKAMDMHASGYVVKPAEAERIEWELEELRYPEYQKEHKRVFAQTFGNFEFFVDGKPVEFKYKRTKEIVALLVNNKGAQTTNGEIMATLWEDEGDPDKKVSYLCNLRQDLQNTFTKLKLDGVLVSTDIINSFEPGVVFSFKVPNFIRRPPWTFIDNRLRNFCFSNRLMTRLNGQLVEIGSFCFHSLAQSLFVKTEYALTPGHERVALAEMQRYIIIKIEACRKAQG